MAPSRPCSVSSAAVSMPDTPRRDTMSASAAPPRLAATVDATSGARVRGSSTSVVPARSATRRDEASQHVTPTTSQHVTTPTAQYVTKTHVAACHKPRHSITTTSQHITTAAQLIASHHRVSHCIREQRHSFTTCMSTNAVHTFNRHVSAADDAHCEHVHLFCVCNSETTRMSRHRS
jgi:hypothetical protein